MSTLLFDGNTHKLTLFDSQKKQVGQWDANNVVDHHATLSFVPNGAYSIMDTVTLHKHGSAQDTIDGAYGRFGIARLQDFTAEKHIHRGVAVHAGRNNKGAQNHATMGCIRTVDAAMEAIGKFIAKDPLVSIKVQNNHRQRNPVPHHRADHHPHHPKQKQGQLLPDLRRRGRYIV